MECSKDDYSFSKKQEKMRRVDWKDLVLLPDYAWFRVGGLLLLHTSFTQRSVTAGESKFYLA